MCTLMYGKRFVYPLGYSLYLRFYFIKFMFLSLFEPLNLCMFTLKTNYFFNCTCVIDLMFFVLLLIES